MNQKKAYVSQAMKLAGDIEFLEKSSQYMSELLMDTGWTTWKMFEGLASDYLSASSEDVRQGIDMACSALTGWSFTSIAEKLCEDEPKAITERKVIEGMNLLWQNKDNGFEQTKDALRGAEISWSINDAVDFAKEFGDVTLGEGLETGNIGFGAVFVANALDNERAYAYCAEWLFEDGVGNWLKKNEIDIESLTEEMGEEME